MKSLMVTFCLTMPLLFAADSAHAGIFGRRWERRRAELHGQLSGQVTQQVTGAAAGVEQRLGESLADKVAQESVKLDNELQTQLAALRQQAAGAVAAEAKKLQGETAANMAKLREEATTLVAAEAKKMREELAADLAKLREDNNKQFAEALAKLEKNQAEVQQAIADARTLKEQLMPELTALVKAEVKAGMAAVTNTATTAPVAPTDDKPESRDAQPQPEAVIEKQEEEGSENSQRE